MQPKIRRKGRPKSFHDKQAQSKIQSLDRSLDVLDLLAENGSMTLSEIATSLGQSPATIYRILTTYSLRNFVEIDPATQSWSAGPSTFRIGAAFLRRSTVVERSRPHMRDLMEITGETANLGIAKDDKVLFVSQVETHETIRAFFPPGTYSPLHASGIGKALLSAMPEDRVAKLIKSMDLKRYTERTIVDHDALLHELQKIRSVGYAFDDEERTSGMRCVAAAITNFHGEAVAGISVSGPTNRMTDTHINSVISKAVRAAAQTVSRQLGAK